MKIYDLTVQLMYIDWEIKRELEVPENMTMHQLHLCLQSAMGWDTTHEYKFVAGKSNWSFRTLYRVRGHSNHNSSVATLAQVVKQSGNKFVYKYDFGDNWQHSVEVCNLRDAEAGVAYPRLINATNRCPPEDIGGIPGYIDLLEGLKDPKHPQHEEFVEWFGADFDPNVVDLEELQRDVRDRTMNVMEMLEKEEKSRKRKGKRKLNSRGQWVWVETSKK